MPTLGNLHIIYIYIYIYLLLSSLLFLFVLLLLLSYYIYIYVYLYNLMGKKQWFRTSFPRDLFYAPVFNVFNAFQCSKSRGTQTSWKSFAKNLAKYKASAICELGFLGVVHPKWLGQGDFWWRQNGKMCRCNGNMNGICNQPAI